MKWIRRVLPAMLMLGLVIREASTSLAQEQIRTIEIHAHRFAFSPAEIRLKKGETVKLRLISDDVAHSLVVPDLHIKQEMLKGHPVDVTVAPNRSGDFHGVCGRFCGSGHGSMVFTVHVTD
ncbi:cytochrome c oxidase subunit 2 [Edaphobacter aggregans]|uniref:Cytochrome c oxidase subunit 2 n=2 Tax=Edaphobacter aggregans TaxID=570835 RepID=A0A428MEX0_9BACT|nr:cytochrome c oxidase subunit 2 [Edaphobacter aggregans]